MRNKTENDPGSHHDSLHISVFVCMKYVRYLYKPSVVGNPLYKEPPMYASQHISVTVSNMVDTCISLV